MRDGSPCPCWLAGQDGSVLILVLWLLVMITFLAAQFADTGRERAELARGSWLRVEEDAALRSTLVILASGSLASLADASPYKDWVSLTLNGWDIRARTSSEKDRIPLNTADGSTIRGALLRCLGDDADELRIESLTDAILDWRDPDDLTRLHGAEKEDYAAEGKVVQPADGPFVCLPELLMVRGVTPGLFWGDPWGSIEKKPDEIDKNVEMKEKRPSLLDLFTIYGNDVTRVEMVMRHGGNRKGYVYFVGFMKKKKNGWNPVHVHRVHLVAGVEKGDS